MTTLQKLLRLLPAAVIMLPAFSQAQVPVDDDGQVIGQVSPGAEIMPLGEDDIPRLSSIELQELVGPVALYPDDLLAVVLPASAYPLQVAAAARFLEARQDDPTLEPNPDWDDSIVALLNYPEVVELLNRDLDWTYRLGEAVVAQQADVVAAVEAFRDRAYAAGNLRSDDYQTIDRRDDVIRITPVSDDAIYVPYYEPARVVVYQPRPVYYYYPRPCPVYYYPYASGYRFDRGFFWGVTTAFSIGWLSDSVHVYHHSYRGHPYYGRYYADRWWYRRPTINIHNTTYVTNTTTNVYVNRTVDIDRGVRWRARDDRRVHIIREGSENHVRDTRARIEARRNVAQREQQYSRTVRDRQPEPIRFKEREFATDQRTTPTRTTNRNVRSPNSLEQPRRTTREEKRRYPQQVRVAPERQTRAETLQRRVHSEAPERQTRSEVRQRQIRTEAPQRRTRTETPQRRARTEAPQRQSRSATPQRQTRSEAPRRERRSKERRSQERR